ncbi:MAG: NAD(+) diphosphatase [Nocardioides sp.]
MSFPHLDVAANAHDRAGARRYDDDWLAEQWGAASARALVISGTRIRPVDGAADWHPTDAVPEGLRVFLGERDGRTWWATLVDPDHAPGDRGEWLGLRQAMWTSASGALEDSALLFHAVGLAEWHDATRFCPRCAGALQARAAGHELQCSDCGKTQFPRTDPAVIMAVTHGQPGAEDEAILLGRQAAWPPGRYSTLAGFVEPGETLEDAVRREVWEETGVVVGDVGYFGNQPWPFPSSLMLGMVGRAQARDLTIDHSEIEDARWFTRAELQRQSEEGSVLVPTRVSIASSLVLAWHGGTLPGTW